MKPGDLAREIVYPLTDMAIILTIAFFWILFAIVKLGMAVLGPVIGGLLGLFLVMFAAPGFLRYLLYLLEARITRKEAPAFDAELFGMSNNLWSMTPLIVISLLVWGEITLAGSGAAWLVAYAFAVALLLPASLAILAVTHSPLESLNPLAIFRMIRLGGWSYILIPVVIVALVFVVTWLSSVGLPSLLLELATFWLLVLTFTLTGGVLAAKGVAVELRIEAPLEAGEEKIAGDLEKEREKIANHAYGFISRGNREGGFKHIRQWIESEANTDEAVSWFFNQMMKWEAKDAALFFGQECFAHFLHHEQDVPALKLMSSCLHENSRWKPRAEDRQHALDLAGRYGREDLVSLLRN